MLKYEGRFKKGDKIRSYGFGPVVEGYFNPYLEGVIVKEDHMTEDGFMAVEILVTDDQEYGDKMLHEFIQVPLEIMFDWDGRVEKVA